MWRILLRFGDGFEVNAAIGMAGRHACKPRPGLVPACRHALGPSHLSLAILNHPECPKAAQVAGETSPDLEPQNPQLLFPSRP